jgi:hypothetical protein
MFRTFFCQSWVTKIKQDRILSSDKLYKEYENLKIRLENRMKHWEELQIELEEL